MAFDIQFGKQCCSVKHDWMNFNYVSFESIFIILHEIYMIIVTHPTTIFHCFRVQFFSGTHCKGVSKQLCVYHLYKNVFLAQTRIRSHLGCIFLFRNSFQYPQSKRYCIRNAFLELLRLSSISQYGEYESSGRLCHCGAALRNFIRNTMHLKAFQNNFAFITSTERVSGSNAYQIALFSAFEKGVSNPLIKTAETLKVVWKP